MSTDAFEKIKSSVNRGITTIGVKTSSSMEKAMIKSSIDSANKDITKYFTSVGEAAYRLWENGAIDNPSLSESFEAIKLKFNEISEFNSRLELIDERDKQILGAKTLSQAESVAQPQQQPEPQVEQTQQQFVCSNCGAQYGVPVKFCRKCGNRISE